MDVADMTKEQRQLHEQLTQALGDALASSDPKAVRALHAQWASVHEERKQQIRDLKRAIQRAEAHFKFTDADALREKLAELE